ncbi:hypothetical protein [Bacillus cihuensis]|uniref:hypothetical protein n=1 Tax=Bacillus cihuensis TaxID=1208599 RepID=UPI0004208A4F|nr:hypothetical protein [Bacillus cihuensis]
MTKICLVSLKNHEDKFTKEVLDTIARRYELDMVFTRDEEDLCSWLIKNDASLVSLILYNGSPETLTSIILPTIKNTYIAWFHNSSWSKESESYSLHGYKTAKSAEEFLHILNKEVIYTPNFKNRVGEHVENLIAEQHIEKNTELEVLADRVSEVSTQAENKEDIEISTSVSEKVIETIFSANYTERELQEEAVPSQNGEKLLTSKSTEGKDENIYFERSRKLQQELFVNHKWQGHQMIGIWAPLHRIGVTSFTMNFSFYLAENRIYTTVLEGLTEQHALKDWLKRYIDIPKDWVSYAKAIQTDINPIHTDWTFKSVKFLPLDHDDTNFKWDSKSLETYMTATNIVDITLVDLPTGKMAPHTEESLKFLDELWILIDDSFQETVAWNDYIQALRKKKNLRIYSIFNKSYPFSQEKRLAKELDLHLLTKIPSMHEQVMKSYYQTEPLYFDNEIKEYLHPAFEDLSIHLFGKVFDKESPNTEITKQRWWRRALKSLNG